MSKTLPGLTHLTNTAVAGFDFDSETKIDRHHSDSGERPSPNLDNMSNKLGRDRAGSASAIPKTIKEKRDSFFKYAKSRWRENSFSLNKSKQENDDCTKGLDVQKMLHMTWLYSRRDSLLLIMKDERGRQLFKEFLESEYSTENLLFWLEIENLKAADTRSRMTKAANKMLHEFFPDNEDIINLTHSDRVPLVEMLRAMSKIDEGNVTGIDDEVALKRLANLKHTPSTSALSPECKSGNRMTRSPSANSMEDMTLLEDVQNTILSLMAMDSFPRFLLSPYCDNYLKVLEERDVTDSTEREVQRQLIAFQKQSKQSKISTQEDWLTKFISMTYVLPFCITISTRVKNPTDQGLFPLSFVNPAYTTCTGYTHAETVGRNCRFLQGPNTEPESVAKLRESVRNGTLCKVSITNYKKNGDEFQNLLTLHPVRDKKGVCVFIIGVQYDVSEFNAQRLASLAPVLEFLSREISV